LNGHEPLMSQFYSILCFIHSDHRDITRGGSRFFNHITSRQNRQRWIKPGMRAAQ
jgi:hypothetical protein